MLSIKPQIIVSHCCVLKQYFRSRNPKKVNSSFKRTASRKAQSSLCNSLTKAQLRLNSICQARENSAEQTLVAEEGDIVTVHFTVFGEGGQRLESSKDAGQPLNFEVGSSEIINNDLLSAFDGAVRGLTIGATRKIELSAKQEEWNQDLLFTVPQDHPEITRLQGKFRNSGGLQEGMIVELANGNQAQVLKVTAENVLLDANDAMAGRQMAFEVEVMSIDKQTGLNKEL